jgi:hypothetical protein
LLDGAFSPTLQFLGLFDVLYREILQTTGVQLKVTVLEVHLAAEVQ